MGCRGYWAWFHTFRKGWPTAAQFGSGRAACSSSHGPAAVSEALRAAQEPGLAAAERSFWEAVAARVVRQLTQGDAVGMH